MKKTIKLNKYDDVFEVDYDWLNGKVKHLYEMSVEMFLNYYTYDDGEWLYCLYLIDQEEQQINYLTQQLQAGFSLFKKGRQEGILHQCTNRNYQYQFSYFDKKGAVGDIQKDTLKEMAKSINEYGFKLCSKEEMTIIT